VKRWAAVVAVFVLSASVCAVGGMLGRARVVAEIAKTLALTSGSIRSVRRLNVELELYGHERRERSDARTPLVERRARLKVRARDLHRYVRSREEGAIVAELERDLEGFLDLDAQTEASGGWLRDASKQADLDAVYRRLAALREINVAAARVAQRDAASWSRIFFSLGLGGGFFFTAGPALAWIWLGRTRSGSLPALPPEPSVISVARPFTQGTRGRITPRR
jgi:hypothetical protein